MDAEKLPQLALAALQRNRPEVDISINEAEPSLGDPMYGSYHVLFPLTFCNGIRWIAKVPINGTPATWDETSAAALASEVATMRLLKRETTIPLPDVLDYSEATENVIGCPYILMSFISGKPLYDVWFGQLSGASPEDTRARRTRALEDIASAMVQLGKFSFQKGGFPRLREDGAWPEIGPMRRIDQNAMLERLDREDEPSDDTIYSKCPVFDDPKAYYIHFLDTHTEELPMPKAVARILRYLVAWVPEPVGMRPFVLSHPDYDIQNFIVSEEGRLQGIIDWDGVAATPRTIGNERYPGWLTRDWDPIMYGYTESMDDGVEPDGVWEDSPESLAYYRNVYSSAMSSKLAEEGHDSDRAKLCRMSLITDNLAIAVDDPRCRNGILRRMVQEMSAIAGPDDELDFMDLTDAFVEDDVDEETMERLRRGFQALLSKQM